MFSLTRVVHPSALPRLAALPGARGLVHLTAVVPPTLVPTPPRLSGARGLVHFTAVPSAPMAVTSPPGARGLVHFTAAPSAPMAVTSQLGARGLTHLTALTAVPRVRALQHAPMVVPSTLKPNPPRLSPMATFTSLKDPVTKEELRKLTAAVERLECRLESMAEKAEAKTGDFEQAKTRIADKIFSMMESDTETRNADKKDPVMEYLTYMLDFTFYYARICFCIPVLILVPYLVAGVYCAWWSCLTGVVTGVYSLLSSLLS